MRSCKARAKLRYLACALVGNVCMSVEPHRPQEQRCFRLLHVKTLSIAVAVVEIAMILWQMLLCFSVLTSAPSSHSFLFSSIHIIVLLLSLTAIILLLSGILCQTPNLLMPHMLMQVIIIVTLFCLAAFSLYTLLCGTSISIRVIIQSIDTPAAIWTENTRSTVAMEVISRALIGVLVMVAIGYIFLGCLNLWFFHIVLDCYRWLSIQLEEKNAALSSCMSTSSSPVSLPTTLPKSPDEGTDL